MRFLLPVKIARGVGMPLIRRMADLKATETAGGKTADPLANIDGFAEVYPEDNMI